MVSSSLDGLPPPPAGYAMRLPSQPEAVDLLPVGTDTAGRPVLLAREAAGPWRAMETAAQADGVRLLLVSGFRSVQRQAEVLQRKLAAGQSLEEILRVVAYPGHSEHHTGTAVDLASPEDPPLTEAFARSAAYAWLRRRAAGFGFSLSYPPNNHAGIVFEPWHWRWRSATNDVHRG